MSVTSIITRTTSTSLSFCINENKEFKEAIGKFDIALATDPKLDLIPIASFTKLTELLTTPETIKAQVGLAKDLLKDSKVQAARELLAPLQDDLVTSTTSLPMTTYPDAIKLATKMLVEGKKEAALETLSTLAIIRQNHKILLYYYSFALR